MPLLTTDIEATMTQSRPWSGLEDDAKDDIGSNRHGKIHHGNTNIMTEIIFFFVNIMNICKFLLQI
ncbi:hypothetical protein EJB05_08979, partial [Eragrostis curvula]